MAPTAIIKTGPFINVSSAPWHSGAPSILTADRIHSAANGGRMVRTSMLSCAGVLAGFLSAANATAQLSPTADWAAHAQNQYAVAANITYLTASGYESKLDIYRRRDLQTPQPTLVFYHGGGWI